MLFVKKLLYDKLCINNDKVITEDPHCKSSKIIGNLAKKIDGMLQTQKNWISVGSFKTEGVIYGSTRPIAAHNSSVSILLFVVFESIVSSLSRGNADIAVAYTCHTMLAT